MCGAISLDSRHIALNGMLRDKMFMTPAVVPGGVGLCSSEVLFQPVPGPSAQALCHEPDCGGGGWGGGRCHVTQSGGWGE